MEQILINKVEDIEQIIRSHRIFLVRDSAYNFLNIKFFLNSFSHVEFSDYTPNPLYQQVVNGVKLFNENKCDMIIAVGGGSTIDVAKCIKLFCKMDHSTNYLNQEQNDSEIPVIAIPTTAGTGSESTRHAVIYFNGKKQSISHESIIPNYIVLDASLLVTLPSYQKKSTMLDALCQSIESWWSVNSTDESKNYSRKSILLIKAHWENYIFNNEQGAANKILEAANLSGRAINITATTAAHAMSYKVTSLYNYAHGHAVAVCLPEVWKYMLEHTDACIDCRGEEYIKNTFIEISEEISLDFFISMLKKLEMTYPYSSNKTIDIDELVSSVNPIRLQNNPVKLSSEVLKGMYERIVQ